MHCWRRGCIPAIMCRSMPSLRARHSWHAPRTAAVPSVSVPWHQRRRHRWRCRRAVGLPPQLAESRRQSTPLSTRSTWGSRFTTAAAVHALLSVTRRGCLRRRVHHQRPLGARPSWNTTWTPRHGVRPAPVSTRPSWRGRTACAPSPAAAAARPRRARPPARAARARPCWEAPSGPAAGPGPAAPCCAPARGHSHIHGSCPLNCARCDEQFWCMSP